jgi:hypothetical protein
VRNWTEGELITLRVLFPKRSRKFLAVTLNKSEGSVREKAREMGLKKKSGSQNNV